MIIQEGDESWGTCPSSLSEQMLAGVPVEVVDKWTDQNGVATAFPAYSFSLVSSAHESGECDEDGGTTKKCNYGIKLKITMNMAQRPINGTIGASGTSQMTLNWTPGNMWTDAAGVQHKNLSRGFVVGPPQAGVPASRTFHIAFNASCGTTLVFKVLAQSQQAPPANVGSKDFNYSCGSCTERDPE